MNRLAWLGLCLQPAGGPATGTADARDVAGCAPVATTRAPPSPPPLPCYGEMVAVMHGMVVPGVRISPGRGSKG